MKEIYKNDSLKITEEKKTIFIIEMAYMNQVLINSLLKTKIIQGGVSTNNYSTIKFKASSVKSLNQFQEERQKQTGSKNLTISEVASLVSNLSLQLKYLIEQEHRTIIGYTPENIIVINEKKFAFLGSELISEIEDNKTIISYPFTPNDFFVSPELLKIRELPSYVHYKTAYFSLGCLVLHTLLSDNDFYIKYLKEKSIQSNVIELLDLHPIKNTKIYWLLSRCLMEEPESRSIILI
jgi:hypothetical protein